jgi:hypothetical protein
VENPKAPEDKNMDFPGTISLFIYLLVSIQAIAYTFRLLITVAKAAKGGATFTSK